MFAGTASSSATGNDTHSGMRSPRFRSAPAISAAKDRSRLLQNRFLSSLLVASLFSTVASAQKLTVTPSGVVKAGDTVTISYSNANKAKTDVTVLVMGGFPTVTVIEVRMTLDENGNGTGTWVVDGTWRGATFSAPDASDVTILIQ